MAMGRPTSAPKSSPRRGSGTSSPSVWNSSRMKYVPGVSSVECWSRSTTLAPWWKRKVETAETMPGRSAQRMRRMACMGVLCNPVGTLRGIGSPGAG